MRSFCTGKGSVFVEREVGKRAGDAAVGVVGVGHEIDAHDFGGFFLGIKTFEIVIEVAGFSDPGVYILVAAFGDNAIPFEFEHPGNNGGYLCEWGFFGNGARPEVGDFVQFAF